jgi:hypothetical protein
LRAVEERVELRGELGAGLAVGDRGGARVEDVSDEHRRLLVTGDERDAERVELLRELAELVVAPVLEGEVGEVRVVDELAEEDAGAEAALLEDAEQLAGFGDGAGDRPPVGTGAGDEAVAGVEVAGDLALGAALLGDLILVNRGGDRSVRLLVGDAGDLDLLAVVFQPGLDDRDVAAVRPVPSDLWVRDDLGERVQAHRAEAFGVAAAELRCGLLDVVLFGDELRVGVALGAGDVELVDFGAGLLAGEDVGLEAVLGEPAEGFLLLAAGLAGGGAGLPSVHALDVAAGLPVDLGGSDEGAEVSVPAAVDVDRPGVLRLRPHCRRPRPCRGRSSGASAAADDRAGADRLCRACLRACWRRFCSGRLERVVGEERRERDGAGLGRRLRLRLRCPGALVTPREGRRALRAAVGDAGRGAAERLERGVGAERGTLRAGGGVGRLRKVGGRGAGVAAAVALVDAESCARMSATMPWLIQGKRSASASMRLHLVLRRLEAEPLQRRFERLRAVLELVEFGEDVGGVVRVEPVVPEKRTRSRRRTAPSGSAGGRRTDSSKSKPTIRRRRRSGSGRAARPGPSWKRRDAARRSRSAGAAVGGAVVIFFDHPVGHREEAAEAGLPVHLLHGGELDERLEHQAAVGAGAGEAGLPQAASGAKPSILKSSIARSAWSPAKAGIREADRLEGAVALRRDDAALGEGLLDELGVLAGPLLDVGAVGDGAEDVGLAREEVADVVRGSRGRTRSRPSPRRRVRGRCSG